MSSEHNSNNVNLPDATDPEAPAPAGEENSNINHGEGVEIVASGNLDLVAATNDNTDQDGGWSIKNRVTSFIRSNNFLIMAILLCLCAASTIFVRNKNINTVREFSVVGASDKSSKAPKGKPPKAKAPKSSTESSSEPSLSPSESDQPSTSSSSQPSSSSEPSLPPSESAVPSSEPSLSPSESVDPSSEPSLPPSESVVPSSEPSLPPSESAVPSSEPSLPPSESAQPSTSSQPSIESCVPEDACDPTYFQSTMEYRQRVGQQLDNVLRFACTLRCFNLAMAVLDAIVMFKIGLMDATATKDLKWFDELMVKQYGKDGTPKLILEEKYLGVPTVEPTTNTESSTSGEEEGKMKTDAEKKEEEKNKLVQLIAQARQVTTTDDKMSLEMQITRRHAESFTREKLAMCQRQGIPPQIGMQAYRESWFFIVRAYKLNDEDGVTRVTNWDGAMGGANPNHFEVLRENKHPIFEMLSEDTTASFEKEFDTNGKDDVCDRKVIVGWPFVISNVAQKSGKVKIHLPPPDVPGKYEFCVTIKSQEFLCGVEEFKLVVDVAQGVPKKKDEEEEGKDEDKESKKDK